MYNKAQAIKDGRAAVAAYENQAAAFEREARELETAAAQIEREFRESLRHLAVRLVPRPNRGQVEHVCAELDDTRLQGLFLRAERRLAGYHARLSEIDRVPDYQDREALVDPVQGSYTLELARAQQAHDEQAQRVAIYDFKAFQWLYHNGFHLQRQPTGFQKFLRTITLTPLRERNALAKVREQLGDEDFGQLAERYGLLAAELATRNEQFEHWRGLHQTLLDLIQEHVRLERAIEDHDRLTLEEIQTATIDLLARSNLAQIHNRIRPAARPLVAKAEALQRKSAYLAQMQTWTAAAAEERRQRIGKINRVVGIWARKPYGHLQPSKRRWLVELPRQKGESTAKQVDWVRGLRLNIMQFTDYVGYSILMHELGAAMLAYDAFSMHALVPIPPETFTRDLFSDLDLFRETYHYEQGIRHAYRRIANHSSGYVETDWDIWDEDDYYESEAADAMAADWSEEDGQAGDIS